MHSSQHAALARRPQYREDRAGNLSFPPTQRPGLLATPSAQDRSRDQVANFLHSSHELLDALNVQPLAHAAAL